MQGPYFAPAPTNADVASIFGDTNVPSPYGPPYQAIAPRPALNGMAYPYSFAPGGSMLQYGGYPPIGFQPHPHEYGYTLNRELANTMPQGQGMYGFPNANAHTANFFPMAEPNGTLPQQSSSAPESTMHATTKASQNPMPWPYSPAPSTLSHSTQAAHTPLQSNPHAPKPNSDTASQAQSVSQTPPNHLSWGLSNNIQPFLNEAAVADRYLQPLQDAAQDFVTEELQGMLRTSDNAAPLISNQQEPEDDWFDVDSDHEITGLKDTSKPEIGMLIARNAQQNLGDLRSMSSFLNEPNVLSTYNPAYSASPLKDPQTARVFCHFITATGPTLHVCERHPSNPAVIFSGRPVPKSQQGLWTYTLPMLALRHQGLLHSMLALASLHIAKLQQTSPTPSLRHYHYALRWVAKALGHDRKRRDAATLAATLLLGYYEVTTAEHNKWNSHLSGARELIMDISYVKLAKKVDAYRRQSGIGTDNSITRRRHYSDDGNGSISPSDFPTFQDEALDYTLINTLMGWDTRSGDAEGRVVDHEHSPEPQVTSRRDVEEYETQVDLFWWYAKQDTYQSILSGNRLLLSYERWAFCPPRAAMGRVDAVYGTMDHLFLIMARLADFAGKDLSRKKRASIEAHRAAKAARDSPPASAQTSPSFPPPMYGMIPDPGPVRVPKGFSQERHDSMYNASPESDFQPLDVALNEAMAEWNAIAHAFDVFYSSLGPSFEPLSADHMPPLSTPFGPAMCFRSYGIACVLTLYYCGRIILTRTHPKMPPAAMAAALVARSRTEPFANAIGRICAGIQPVSNTAPLNPHHGAALMDVCMGLFHAGVQFQDPAQRGWTITKLRDVVRLTGWQTSSLVASGCERAWIHYAQIGKGPPYERTMNKTAKDDRVSGRSRDPDFLRTQPKDNNDRRFVHMNAGTRVYWAMGVLSVEDDMKELNLGE